MSRGNDIIYSIVTIYTAFVASDFLGGMFLINTAFANGYIADLLFGFNKILVIILYLAFCQSLPGSLLENYSKYYVYVNIFIVAGGVISWLAVISGVVNPLEWQFQDGLMKQDTYSIIDKNIKLYSMPYNLGIVLFGRSALFGEFLFPRLAGFSREPNIAALFTIPSLFLVGTVIKNKITAKYIYILYIIYIFALFSTTAFLSLTMIFTINYIVGKKGRIFKFTIMLLSASILIIIVANSSFIQAKLITYEYQSLLHNYLGGFNRIGLSGVPLGVITRVDESMNLTRSIFSISFQLIFILYIINIIYKYLKNSDKPYIYYSAVYVFLHSTKSFVHVAFTLNYIYILIILGIIIREEKMRANKYVW